jgi:hypothetical protein
MITYMDNPELWRKRAEEVRVQAEQVSDGPARRGMLAVAEGYERMAERTEQRIAERRTLSGDNE